MGFTSREIFLLVGFSAVILLDKIASSFSGPSLAPPQIPNSRNSSFLNLNTTDSRRPQESTKIYWGVQPVPCTKLLTHKMPGFTIFDSLYIFNGTYFIVTDEPEKFPERRLMVAAGLPMSFDPVEVEMNEPTNKDLRIVSPREATELFGSFASRIDGVTFIVNESPQFITHYYHFIVELITFGLWRLYSSLQWSLNSSETLPLPRRLIFPHASRTGWQDRPGVNQWVVRAAFPSIGIETSEDWALRASFDIPFVFDRVVLIDRPAWHRGPFLKAPETTYPLDVRPGFWEPIRQNVVSFAAPHNSSEPDVTRPVITYISRQKTSRRLKDADHEGLVRALRRLEEEHGYEVQIPVMEEMDKNEQIYLASRTTILLSVHGNGLSATIWMKPSPRATVIEMMKEGGFAWDYEYTARALGIRHYGVWFDKYFTVPDLPPEQQPDGFHGSEITVDGEAVANLIHERLSSPNPLPQPTILTAHSPSSEEVEDFE